MQAWLTKEPRHLRDARWMICRSVWRKSWTRTGTIARWNRGSMPATFVKNILLSSEMT